ncbi:hypothetical protein TW85_09590 [Marinomonas sp. S3726]|uniref:MaoC/PaaZ C-terminal domain-containing protein n=1 Tax=Marinomonas sp. S3726 TaxID=579484 RepID=UPI0005FA7E8F|nr:MaoC/PaaZ C-terminal domain-containing protein [Marinomonas sp. S3726]KJZ14174.1 hypothetical protein TW85_09590 [Marinomonas sp. S3726]
MHISSVSLNFDKKPSLASPLIKALCLPRKGFKPEIGIPAIKASWPRIKIDTQAHKAYCQTLGLKEGKHLPLLYPHVLAGGMHMHMLTHKDFPIGLLGAVHLKNKIRQIRPIKINEVIRIDSELGEWRITEKGLEFDFSTFVSVNNQVVWSEISTYFKKGKFPPANKTTEPDSNTELNNFELNTLEDTHSGANWLIPKNRGKVYAKISGDYNPIHISKTLAKLFGLKRDIAHGFGVLAQALASNGIDEITQGHTQLALDTVFKGPLFLEETASVKLAISDDNGLEQGFDIYCGKNPKPSICAHLQVLN